MEYYQALEDPKGTLLMRYFMSDDDEVKAKAFHEIQHAMDSLVSRYIITCNETAYILLTVAGLGTVTLRARG